jgi:hypothetical protein
MGRRSARLGAISVEVSADLGPMKQSFGEGKTVAAQAGREMAASVASGFKQTMQAVASSTMNIAGAGTLSPGSAVLTQHLQAAAKAARMSGLSGEAARMRILLGDGYGEHESRGDMIARMGGMAPPKGPGRASFTGVTGAAVAAGAYAAIHLAVDVLTEMATLKNKFELEHKRLGTVRGQLSRMGYGAEAGAVGAEMRAGEAAYHSQAYESISSKMGLFGAVYEAKTGTGATLAQGAKEAELLAQAKAQMATNESRLRIRFSQLNPDGTVGDPMKILRTQQDEELRMRRTELIKAGYSNPDVTKEVGMLRDAHGRGMKFAGMMRSAQLFAADQGVEASRLNVAGAEADLRGNSLAGLAARRQGERMTIEGSQRMEFEAADPEMKKRLKDKHKFDLEAFDLQTQMSAKTMAMGAGPGISMGGMNAMAVGGINATTQQNMDNVPRLLEQILAALTAPQHVNGN